MRATIWKVSRMVMRKVRLNPPSASFAKLTISAGLRSTDSAANWHSPSTLKSKDPSALCEAKSVVEAEHGRVRVRHIRHRENNMYETYIHRPDV
jgi:hypothetical protein